MLQEKEKEGVGKKRRGKVKEIRRVCLKPKNNLSEKCSIHKDTVLSNFTYIYFNSINCRQHYVISSSQSGGSTAQLVALTGGQTVRPGQIVQVQPDLDPLIQIFLR